MSLSKEDGQNLQRDYLNGMTLKNLSIKYQLASCTIINRLQRLGIYNPTHNKWTDAEIQILKDNYETSNNQEITNLLPGRSLQNIFTKASKLSLSRKNIPFSAYSQDEIDILKSHYPKMSAREIKEAFFPYRSIGSISNKLGKMGLLENKQWSDDEESILRNNYEFLSIEDICNLIPSRSRNAIIIHAENLGLTSADCNRFSEFESEFVRNHYEEMGDDEISDVLGRSQRAVKNHRLYLGLKRQTNMRFSDMSEFLRQNNYKWKIDSMRDCKYKCVISGNRFNAIHHLYGMNLIQEETYLLLGINKDFDINQTDKETKEHILDVFHSVEYKYPLGVCLTRDIHMKFHNQYGYGNNTPSQFEEFKMNYSPII